MHHYETMVYSNVVGEKQMAKAFGEVVMYVFLQAFIKWAVSIADKGTDGIGMN